MTTDRAARDRALIASASKAIPTFEREARALMVGYAGDESNHERGMTDPDDFGEHPIPVELRRARLGAAIPSRAAASVLFLSFWPEDVPWVCRGPLSSFTDGPMPLVRPDIQQTVRVEVVGVVRLTAGSDIPSTVVRGIDVPPVRRVANIYGRAYELAAPEKHVGRSAYRAEMVPSGVNLRATVPHDCDMHLDPEPVSNIPVHRVGAPWPLSGQWQRRSATITEVVVIRLVEGSGEYPRPQSCKGSIDPENTGGRQPC